jgi:hypothetical protein
MLLHLQNILSQVQSFSSQLFASPLNVFLLLLLVISFFWRKIRKFGRSKPDSINSWWDYLRGQFLFLATSLVVGIGWACITFGFGPAHGKTSEGMQIIDYGVLELTDTLVLEEADVEHFSRVSVMAKTLKPENGSATVILYGDAQDGHKPEIGRIKTVASSWNRWDQSNTGKRLSIVVGDPSAPAAVPATQIHLLVSLSPK